MEKKVAQTKRKKLVAVTARRNSTPMVCTECGARFRKVISRYACEVECPRCHSTSTEPGW